MHIMNYYSEVVLDLLDLQDFNQANQVFCSEKDLLLLQETRPILMSAVESPADLLSFTSTCKVLNCKRWEGMACHAATMSGIFAAALAQDCAGLGWCAWIIGIVEESQRVEKILGVFERSSYQTKIFLKMPLGTPCNLHITGNLVSQIKMKFPQAVVEEEHLSERRNSVFFSFGCS